MNLLTVLSTILSSFLPAALGQPHKFSSTRNFHEPVSRVELPTSSSLNSCGLAIIFGNFGLLTTLPVLIFDDVPKPSDIEDVRVGIRKKINCFSFLVDKMKFSFYKDKVRDLIFKPWLDRETVVSFNEKVKIDGGRMEFLLGTSILSILDGKHLQISGNHFPPYVYSKLVNGVRQFGGANYQIVNSASGKLNFTFDLDAPVGKPTGSLLPNGTWTGLFGDVYYRKADVAIVLAHTLDRNGQIDFTSSFGSANLIFSTAFPKISLKPEAIVYSYDVVVWSMIFLTITTMIPAAYLSLRAKHRGKHHLVRSCVMVYKITLEQSGEIPAGLEILAGLYLSFIIIIGTGYKCNLLAALSFPEAGKIPRNFPELAVNANYDVHFDMSGIAGYNYFMQGNSPMIVNLRTRFAPNLVRNNPAKCAIASFLEPATACIGWDTVLNQAIGKNLTLTRGLKPVYLTQEAITKTWVTIGLQKNSVYTPAFNFIASSYFETGHITKWHKDIIEDFTVEGIPWMKAQKGSKTYEALLLMQELSGTNSVHSLELNNVQIIFLAFTFGIIVSLLSFLCEMTRMKRGKGKLTSLTKAAGLMLQKRKQQQKLEMKQLELENAEREERRMDELRQNYTLDFSQYTNNYEPNTSKVVDFERGDEFKLLYMERQYEEKL